MSVLQNKIDFAAVLRVKHANPNGDPLNGNRPRTDYNGYGEITDVCLKRKIRDRLQNAGLAIFVQSDDRKQDGARSLRERAESAEWGLGPQAFKLGGKKPRAKAASKKRAAATDQAAVAHKEATTGAADLMEINEQLNATKEHTATAACQKWFDVRSFGNLFAWEKTDDADSVSIPIRGPVTVQSAFSVQPVEVTSTQITKSVSGEGDGTKRGADTMGMKHRVDDGVYVFYGSMNPQLAERTGFSDEDAEAIKRVLPKLFENDASSARPEGSMEVLKVIWWKHGSKSGRYSSAKVHRTLSVKPDGEIALGKLDGLEPEIIDGF
jgi:CRISPR-associated protein Csd2